MKYDVYYLAATTPGTAQIKVVAEGDAGPNGYTNIGSFYHGVAGVNDSSDTLGIMHSHTIYDHVQKLLNAMNIYEDIPLDHIQSFDPLCYVVSVTLAPASHTMAANETVQLVPTVLPAQSSNKAVTYTSSDITKATVSASGLVTGIATGEATITVHTVDGAKTATSVITIS